MSGVLLITGASRGGGEPDEGRPRHLWLLSDEASFTTGSFIDVGGGR